MTVVARLLGGVAAGALGVLAATVAWLSAFGGGAFTVTSGSMMPALQTGDLVLIERVAPRDIQAGDIVAFATQGQPEPTVHRAMRAPAITEAQAEFITRGDANAVPERWSVPRDGHVGRVRASLPRVGLITAWAAQPAGWILLVVAPALGLAILELRRLTLRRTA